MESGIKTTFQAHHEEIRRRSTVASDDLLNSTTFTRVEDDTTDDPFINPEQQFVVFSISHKEFAPRPESDANPAVCIMGLFETRDEAVVHAHCVQKAHPDISVLVDQTHKWIVAAATVEHLTDAAYIDAHVSSLIERHTLAKRSDDENFQDMVHRREAGPIHRKSVAIDDATTVNETPNPPCSQRFKISQGCRINDQKLVVMSYVRDDGDLPEFLFRVYAAFDTESHANRYVRNTCGNEVIDHHIDMFQTGAWIFPQTMVTENAQKEVYRSDELNLVMTTHRKNPQEVERFMKENDRWSSGHCSATDGENCPDTAVAAGLPPSVADA